MESTISTTHIPILSTLPFMSTNVASRALCSCFYLILLCGCNTHESENDEGVREHDCTPSSLYVVENTRWPAGGHELIVRAEDENGLPWKGDEDCLTLKADADFEINSTHYPLESGLTLLVVQPGNLKNWSDYREAIQTFIEGRPDEERIALYGWGDSFVQASDFTTNRQSLSLQIDRLQRLSETMTRLDVRDVFEQAVGIVEKVEAPYMHGHRSLVFVVSDRLSDTIPEDPHAATVQWVVPSKTADNLVEGHRVVFDGSNQLKEALVEVSKRLDQHAEAAFYRIGVCSDPNQTIPATLSAGSEQHVDVILSESLEGERAGNCDLEQIAKSERSAVHTIELLLSDDELEVYQERVDDIISLAIEYELPTVAGQMRLLTEGFATIKDPFDLRVAFNSSEEPIIAKGHLRGQSAIFCARKSYTINLAGKDARFFDEQSGSDEFYLISMCQDPGLFFGFLGDNLYSQYDLFPLHVRYVEVVFNGKTKGVYLMMEKREEELQRDSGRLRGVIRRRYEILVPPEIEYSSHEAETLLTAYDALNNEEIDDETLPTYLRERMDLDQYLRWIALNSMLHNADTIDETLFVSTETIDVEGHPMDYFRLMAWDPEDMQGTCDATEPFVDDFGLTYCQEASFEHKILSHPGIFREYVKILKALLEDLTVERFQSELDRAKEQLFPLLERDGVAQAMQRPEIYDVQSLEAMVLQQMQEAKQGFESRCAELRAALQVWESEN